jgi:4-carboxymuconolactone decarboxylase
MSRRRKGRALLHRIHQGFGEESVKALGDRSPALQRFITDFAFGEVYARPGLDLKTRQLVTIAMVGALGNAPSQLKSHIHGALQLGWTRDQIREVLLQLAVYAGFPAAMNAMAAAQEAFADHTAARPSKFPRRPRRG